jgi:hypothetical protein
MKHCKTASNLLQKSTICYEIRSIKQAALNLNLNVKKTRKKMFLEQMEKVVPWADFLPLNDC